VRAHRVYGFSPVQQVLMTVNIALRRQLWQLDYFTEGSIPDALIGVPQGWTPDQIKQFQDSPSLTLPHSRGRSAVPQTLHARLEIARAIRTLAGPGEDELLRQRRAEIAAIRRDLEALSRDIRKAGEEWLVLAKAELRAALKKYSPDQPRVPAGNPDGGQWTNENSLALRRIIRQARKDHPWWPPGPMQF
jgi:phage portal protein BeeE